MPLNIERIYDSLQNFDFSTFFTDELGWTPSTTKKAIDMDDLYLLYPIVRLMHTLILESV